MERMEALRQYDILDTPPEPVFDEAVKLAATICDAPMAVITILDVHRQWFKACIGFDTRETDSGQYNSIQHCFWASGAAFFIKAKLYHEMGGLDEYFFAHQEEIDLCWRLQLSGYKIFVQPASVVYHVGGGTLPRGNSRKTFLNFRNNLIMLYKNLPVRSAVWKLPVRFLLDAIAAWRGLLNGDAGFYIAVLKAHWHFIKWVLFEKHQKGPAKKNHNSFTGWYNGSIVWDHFVKKKKTFSEIIADK